jgi:hypothetical protein
MANGRARLALWIVCAGVIAWVWLRPLHEGPLPAPVAHSARKARAVDPGRASLAQPEDEPVADEPTARPVQSGPPEMLNRHDLENAMLKVMPKVMKCHDVEQFTGLVTVKLTIAKTGNLQSVSVLPPSTGPTGETPERGAVAGIATGECVRKALRGLSFPRFRGTYVPTIEWTYPFLFKAGG